MRKNNNLDFDFMDGIYDVLNSSDEIVYGDDDIIYVDDETLYDGSGFKWIKISGEDAYVVATYLSIKVNLNYITPVNEPVKKKQKRYDVWQYGFNALPSWLGISIPICAMLWVSMIAKARF